MFAARIIVLMTLASPSVMASEAICPAPPVATPAKTAATSARVVLVRGAGPTFCAGADITERKGVSAEWLRERRLRGFAAYDAIQDCGKPCIAVAHGPVIGSGGIRSADDVRSVPRLKPRRMCRVPAPGQAKVADSTRGGYRGARRRKR